MGTFSPTHWIIILAMAAPLLALFIVPIWRILQRAGFNGAWALLMFVPLANMLLLWFVAFSAWPKDREGKTSTSKGWLVVGVLLVPLALVAPVLLSKVALDGPAIGYAPGVSGAPTANEGAPKTMTYEEAFGLPPKR